MNKHWTKSKSTEKEQDDRIDYYKSSDQMEPSQLLCWFLYPSSLSHRLPCFVIYRTTTTNKRERERER